MTGLGLRQDPAVASIERILEEAAVRSPAGSWQGRVRHAVYICACCTEDASPDWIIYDTDDGIGWRRFPNGLPEDEEVDAPCRADGHADPADVLRWLEGTADDPWTSGDGDKRARKAVSGLRRWLN